MAPVEGLKPEEGLSVLLPSLVRKPEYCEEQKGSYREKPTSQLN